MGIAPDPSFQPKGWNTGLTKVVTYPEGLVANDRASVLLSQQTTGISASYCCVRAPSRVLTSKIQDRPQSIRLGPLGTQTTQASLTPVGQTGSHDRSSCRCCPLLPFPEPYVLNRGTGVTQGNPLEGTSSTQPSLCAWSPDLERLPTSGTLPYPRQPTPASAFILVRRTRVKTEHGLPTRP